jgi:hypothetical protein
MCTSTFTVDDLFAKSYSELETIYRGAPAPSSLASGKLTGRMLAWRGADRGMFGRVLRRFAMSPRFVWQGKTFIDDGGYNRVFVDGILGRQHVFPFASRIEPSIFDGKPTIIIDYDRDANPWWMRAITDEIREVAPGLFLGLDLWKGRGLVWFSLSRTA